MLNSKSDVEYGRDTAVENLLIRQVTEEMAPSWNEFVASHERATIYHRFELLGLLSRLFGHQTRGFTAVDESGVVVGILPVVRLKSLLFGDFMVSMPYFNYGGAIADSLSIEAALMRRVAEYASQHGVAHVEFRDEIERDASWCLRTDKVTMELALPDNPGRLLSSFGSKLRSQIRRPTKEGATALVGGVELVDQFYHVFSRNMRDLGTPVYSRLFFDQLLQQFPDETSIHVVQYEGRPVACGLTIRNRPGVTEIPWASSLREYNRISANMLLYWSVLERAVEEGQSRFDFGRCTRDTGTYRFKKQWGAVERGLNWHYWLSSPDKMPALNPANPKFQLAISIWKQLPLWVTNRLGPVLVRNLP